jgi:hypothetical protein
MMIGSKTEKDTPEHSGHEATRALNAAERAAAAVITLK